MLKWFFRRKKY